MIGLEANNFKGNEVEKRQKSFEEFNRGGSTTFHLIEYLRLVEATILEYEKRICELERTLENLIDAAE